MDVKIWSPRAWRLAPWRRWWMARWRHRLLCDFFFFLLSVFLLARIFHFFTLLLALPEGIYCSPLGIFILLAFSLAVVCAAFALLASDLWPHFTSIWNERDVFFVNCTVVDDLTPQIHQRERVRHFDETGSRIQVSSRVFFTSSGSFAAKIILIIGEATRVSLPHVPRIYLYAERNHNSSEPHDRESSSRVFRKLSAWWTHAATSRRDSTGQANWNTKIGFDSRLESSLIEEKNFFSLSRVSWVSSRVESKHTKATKGRSSKCNFDFSN